ncbi:MAG: hypothetical protein R2911_28420 [Caldilineaceae bacterium]
MTFTYDNLGRLTSQTDPLGHTVSYAVDKLDRTVALTQDSRTESWQFALDGSLTTHTDFAEQITHFTYDVDQRLTQVDYPANSADASYMCRRRRQRHQHERQSGRHQLRL